MAQKNRPIKVFKAGAVRASIWSTETQKNGRTVKRYSVGIRRRVRKQDGSYMDAKYYWPRNLPGIILVTQKACEFVSLVQSEESEELTPA